MKDGFDDALRTRMGQIARELGDEWQYSDGVAPGYGLPRMQFAGLANPREATSIRVWWWESEVRISAILGVPYEASEEVFTNSVDFVADIVLALCRDEYVRLDGRVEVRVGRKRVHLTEWADQFADPLSPW